MDREVNIELIRYRDLQTWKPAVGDIIIRHGWIIRTKWFGVVNSIGPTGDLNVVRDGMMRLLVITPSAMMSDKSATISPNTIKSAMPGAYVIMQQDSASGNAAIWYV